MSDNDLVQPVTWYSPRNYPSRVSDELAINIATEIMHGASINSACMMYGVLPPRAKQWLRWGVDAYMRDADDSDRQADYLNFLLKVSQAVGLAAVPAQQQARIEGLAWWLTHNPEQRNEWGQPIGATSVLPEMEEEPEGDMNAPAALPLPTTDEVRQILRTMIAAGGAIDVEQDGMEGQAG